MKLYGIQNGAVLQRNGKGCGTVIRSEHCGKLCCSIGKLTEISENTWMLTDIPSGGPYSVSFTDDLSSVTYNDVYVGDLWLLAGQSNMEGAGWIRDKDIEYEKDPIPAVRAFYMDDEWRPAFPQLHQLWKSSDPAHKRTFAENAESIRKRGLNVVDFPLSQHSRQCSHAVLLETTLCVLPLFFFYYTICQTGFQAKLLRCFIEILRRRIYYSTQHIVSQYKN